MKATTRVLGLLVSVIVATSASGVMQDQPLYTSDFRLEDCEFADDGRNPYFNLTPGHTRWYTGVDDEGADLVVRIQVLARVKRVTFRVNGQRLRVKTRIVEEREWVDDQLVEVSRNYYARCKRTGNIYYFGEDVDLYENGILVSHEGSWLAGRRGAEPGLMMPSVFILGARYRQEVAPGVSEDRAKNVEMGFTLETPMGVFDDCVKVVETTPLEPDEKTIKVYAAGVGLLVDGELHLVEIE